MEKKSILECLEKSPRMLRELMAQVSAERLKERRIPGKWSAHEHACHLARAQRMMIGRLHRFMAEERPAFVPYVPGKEAVTLDLRDTDLSVAMEDFASARKEFVALLHGLKDTDWAKEADHPEYVRYTPYIMARHALFHDHTHMYRIEELWLTRVLPGK